MREELRSAHSREREGKHSDNVAEFADTVLPQLDDDQAFALTNSFGFAGADTIDMNEAKARLAA